MVPSKVFVPLVSNAFGTTSKLVKNLLVECTTKITPMTLLGRLKRMCRPGQKFSTVQGYKIEAALLAQALSAPAVAPAPGELASEEATDEA